MNCSAFMLKQNMATGWRVYIDRPSADGHVMIKRMDPLP